VGHRIEDDHKLGRKLKRQECLLSRSKLDHLKDDRGKPLLQIVW
jgi:hypothetical protein